ncbi:MAG: glycerophosphodiester phosphodiesterase [Pararhodobacter sp.]
MSKRYPFLAPSSPVPIAHRGGAREAEENTLPAFAHALALGYRDIELDVHATRDGVVVVHHDATLLRMSGDARPVAALDWAELREIRTRGGNPIPRLDTVLERFPAMRITIEAKSDAVVAPLAEVVRRAGALDRVCVGSFNAARTRRLRRALGPGLCWSPAHGGVLGLWLRGWGLPLLPMDDFAVVQVPVRFRGVPVVTPRFVRAAQARDIKVQVWTVNDAAEMEWLLDLGVDGIMTDRPGLLRRVLERRGQWHGA